MSEAARALDCTVSEPIDWVGPDRLKDGLESGHYRPEWTWIAEDDGKLLARAVWWGLPDGAHPLALDCLYVHESVGDRQALATRLIVSAHERFRARGMTRLPEFHLFSRTDGNPAQTAAALDWRIGAAAAAGLTDVLRRLRYEWTAGDRPPAAPERLVFRPEPDDEVFLAAFREVAAQTLDTTTRRAVARHGVAKAARDDLAGYRDMPGDRAWWRLAHTPDGTLAGLLVPSRNDQSFVVGYLGVVPALRGRGYVDELLAQTTRILLDAGARRITADTDLVNRPMAAAFDRAGYRNFASRTVLAAPADS
ncbi:MULTISPECIES: GNAT family N-acetyltransferase [unclassified Streptomyces]|uniref:GNAT family N-acetyltransferase n=1 Tax=unclassified Streptomyces TaxID=2593676 RepID=UPI001F3CF4FE|nr:MULTISPECIES: GNAT family N-acetyltransferase [unclassified Streptomyces]